MFDLAIEVRGVVEAENMAKLRGRNINATGTRTPKAKVKARPPRPRGRHCPGRGAYAAARGPCDLQSSRVNISKSHARDREDRSHVTELWTRQRRSEHDESLDTHSRSRGVPATWRSHDADSLQARRSEETSRRRLTHWQDAGQLERRYRVCGQVGVLECCQGALVN